MAKYKIWLKSDKRFIDGGLALVDNLKYLIEEWWRLNLIKPCPFCGGRADLRYSFDKAFIECTNTKCKLQPSTWLRVETDSVNKLVKIWNTRNYEENE